MQFKLVDFFINFNSPSKSFHCFQKNRTPNLFFNFLSLVPFFLFGLYLHFHFIGVNAFRFNAHHPLFHGVSQFEYIQPHSIALEYYPLPNDPHLNHVVLLSFQAYHHTFHFILKPSSLLHPQAMVSSFHNTNNEQEKKTSVSIHDEIALYQGYTVESFLNSIPHLKKSTSKFHFDRIQHTSFFKDSDLNVNLDSSRADFLFHIPVHVLSSKSLQIKEFVSQPFFEGHFQWQGQDYTVASIHSYQLHKRDIDVHVPLPEDRLHPHDQVSQLMVYRTLQDRSKSNVSTTTPPVFKCGNDHDHPFIFNASPFLASSSLSSSSSSLSSSSGSHSFHSNQSHFAFAKRETQLNCPTAKKIIYVGLAADCKYIEQKGSLNNTRTRLLLNFMKLSQLYEVSFNIQLGVTEILLFPSCSSTPFNQPCSSTYSLLQRLSDFSAWRKSASVDAGLWHLYSGCNQGSTIGIAWIGMVCQTQVFQEVTSANGKTESRSGTGITAPGTSVGVDAEWMISAHEIGHSFGASHDCTPQSDCSQGDCCSCSDTTCNQCSTTYLMHPNSDVAQTSFSSCSKKEICNGVNMFGTCLKDPGQKKIMTVAQCGNGIVEEGEECDCGGSTCPNACCEVNCKLKPQAMCDDSSDACCQNCKLASNSTLCRSSNGACDQSEYCDGSSRYCPEDRFVKDGESCSTKLVNGTCASGQCTTRDFQCILRSAVTFSKSVQVTGECPYTKGECSLNCNSKSFGCLRFSGNFLDGTPCGQSGMCFSGECKGDALFASFLQWIVSNPQWAVLIFLLALFIFIGFFYFIRWCIHRHQQKRTFTTPNSVSQVQGSSS